MALKPGTTLGPYEIVAPLGAGGMGEVYRAKDTRLGRDVAIKVLPAHLSKHPEVRQRFEREAKAVSSLNHPHICTLHDVGHQEGVDFLVMECLEGDSLAVRLKNGALPLAEALRYAMQIAGALDKAHRQGVIHRDLKPGNVMITKTGAKLLDFGLARTLDDAITSASGASGVSETALPTARPMTASPTMESPLTAEGAILGTYQYMSPEQLDGKPADARSDIFAFGLLLYEMVTGQRAFTGNTQASLIASIMKEDPRPLAQVAPMSPPALDRLVRTCLEKDPDERRQSLHDVLLDLKWIADPASSASSHPVAGATGDGAAAPVAGGVDPRAGSSRGPGLLALAAVVGAAIGALALWFILQSGMAGFPSAGGPSTVGTTRFEIEPPDDFEMSFPVVTSDGSRVIFFAREVAGTSDERRTFLFTRSLDDLESHRLQETEGVITYDVSPDGRWLTYAVPTSPGASSFVLKKQPLDGSAPPLTLADWSLDWGTSLAWAEGDLILATHPTAKEVIRIPTDGSGPMEPLVLEIPEGARDISLRSQLPGGQRVLVTSVSWKGRGFHDETHVLDYASGKVSRILGDATYPWWSPTGHIVFTRGETLFGVAVDSSTFEPIGAPVPLLDGLGTEQASAGAVVSMSPSGVLLHRPGGRWGVNRRLVHVDTAGNVTPWSDDLLSFQDLAVSPDGNRVATTIMGDDLNFAVWVSDMERPRLRLLAKEPELDCDQPLWMPDSRTVFYLCIGSSEVGRGLYRASADGAGGKERLLEGDGEFRSGTPPLSVTPDGRWLLTRQGDQFSTAARLHLLDLKADDPAATLRLLGDDLPPAWEGAFSPDGRLVAYLGLVNQRREIHVRRFDGSGAVGPAVVVADGDLREVHWDTSAVAGARELVYSDSQVRHWRVRIRTEPGLAAGNPKIDPAFTGWEQRAAAHDQLPDGRHFAIQEGEDEDIRFGSIVVLNFHQELMRLMEAAQ